MRIDTYEVMAGEYPDCMLEGIVADSDKIVRTNRTLHIFMGEQPPSPTIYGEEIDQKRCQLTRAQFVRMKMSEEQLDTFFKQGGVLNKYNIKICEILNACVDELEENVSIEILKLED